MREDIASPTTSLVELRDLTKDYGRGAAAFEALRGVNLRIDSGEFVAVMGPSGSGKSTAMNIIGCLDQPSSGSYLFRGLRVERMSSYQRDLLRRYFLGFVFQGFNLLSRTSALENVELPLVYRGEPRSVRHARAREAVAAVGLEDRVSHTPAELSGGQQQRVAIARAMVTNPSLLLADEPTGNLDTQRSREIMELLSALNRERGVTIVMVTHESDMARYAKRVILWDTAVPSCPGAINSCGSAKDGDALKTEGPQTEQGGRLSQETSPAGRLQRNH